ncbi:hypothetical protein L2E82_06407 [Cichorium intybus]|uniref:Uncharacterized protein n=1 Tax=Cichorium intybus TaxID=13427 RepID=A0ACB9H9V4_CICIN|nr:hypothetical protein L2E82_06407 [Cichorium intybus]
MVCDNFRPQPSNKQVSLLPTTRIRAASIVGIQPSFMVHRCFYIWLRSPPCVEEGVLVVTVIQNKENVVEIDDTNVSISPTVAEDLVSLPPQVKEVTSLSPNWRSGTALDGHGTVAEYDVLEIGESSKKKDLDENQILTHKGSSSPDQENETAPVALCDFVDALPSPQVEEGTSSSPNWIFGLALGGHRTNLIRDSVISIDEILGSCSLAGRVRKHAAMEWYVYGEKETEAHSDTDHHETEQRNAICKGPLPFSHVLDDSEVGKEPKQNVIKSVLHKGRLMKDYLMKRLPGSEALLIVLIITNLAF